MPKFSRASIEALQTCHPDLQRIAHEAIKYADFKVLEGHRGKEAQEDAVRRGVSKVRWPRGKHNRTPSEAFDFAPWPIDWSDTAKSLARFAFVAGVLHTVALQLGIRVRFGWDWNRNLDPRDETFMDWPHVELDNE